MTREEAKIQTPDGATPLTIADAVIRECKDREVIEDVIYYLRCYIKQEFEKYCELKSDSPVGEWETVDSTHDRCSVCNTVMCITSTSINDVGYCPFCGSRLKKRWGND